MEKLKFVLQLIDKVTKPARRIKKALAGVDKATNKLGRNRGLEQLRKRTIVATTAAARLGRAFRRAGDVARRSFAKADKSFDRASKLSIAGFSAIAAGRTGFDAARSPVQESVDFERAMQRVSALTFKGNVDIAGFDRQRKIAKQLGRDTEFTAIEAGEAMQQLAIAGLSAEQQVAALPSVLQLASAGQVGLASASDTALGIMGGFGLKADELGDVVDTLAATFTNSKVTLSDMSETLKFVGPIARKAGSSLQDVSLFIGLLGDAGIEGSLAGTALRQMFLKLANPTSDAAKVLRKLNVEVKDAKGNFNAPVNILRDMALAMEDLGDADKIKNIAEVFDTRAATGMAVLMDSIVSDTSRLGDIQAAIANRGGIAAIIQTETLKGAAGEMVKLESAFSALKIEIGETVLEQFKDLVVDLRNLSVATQEFVAENPGFSGALLKIVAVISGLLVVLGTLGVAAAGATFAWGGLVSAWGAAGAVATALSPAMTIVTNGVLGIGAAAATAGKVVAAFFAGLGAALVGAAAAAAVGVGAAIFSFLNREFLAAKLLEAVDALGEIGFEMGVAISQGLQKGLGSMLPGIVGLAFRAKAAFEDTFGIASPSKVMMKIGEQSASGFRIGMQKGMVRSGDIMRPGVNNSQRSGVDMMRQGGKRGGNSSPMRMNAEFNITVQGGADAGNAKNIGQEIGRSAAEEFGSMLDSAAASQGA